ncbi:MAG: hypothetical protein U9P10_08725 [Thermodesulfobacteriota bacterium]|nr:hypothetical protein [Thermodesulfobacteriota bacterium]
MEEEPKRKKIEAVALKLSHLKGKPSLVQRNSAILFQVQEELEKHDLCLNIVRSNICHLNACDETVTVRCPKLPKDSDARIGVRRDPQNPSKKQKLFGYNMVMTTSVELNLKLELPVAVTNIAGNAEE